MTKIKQLRLLAAAITLVLPSIFNSAKGNDFSFNTLNKNDTATVIREFLASRNHTTVSSAASLGTVIGGFEVGLLGGISNAPGTEAIVRKQKSDANVVLPLGALFARVSLPFCVTLEASGTPSVDLKDVKASHWGAALSCTISDFFPLLPFDMAATYQRTSSELEIKTVINNISTGNSPVNSTLKLNGVANEAKLILSKSFLLFELFAGGGVIFNYTGELGVSGAGNIFDPSFTTKTSTKVEEDTETHFFGGFNVHPLPLLTFGGEYSRLFGTDNFIFKLAVGF